MGREIRRVIPNWEHPKDNKGYKPLLEGFNESREEWWEGYDNWQDGVYPEWISEESLLQARSGKLTYEEHKGEIPKTTDYMPEWGASNLVPTL